MMLVDDDTVVTEPLGGGEHLEHILEALVRDATVTITVRQVDPVGIVSALVGYERVREEGEIVEFEPIHG